VCTRDLLGEGVALRFLSRHQGKDRIRVNCVSAAPLSTAAARGIPGFTALRDGVRARALLPDEVTHADVGDVCTFLASPAARSITGQVMYVDGGFHVTA
jgi:enoyl-[acyl-carrier protein] reductase I